MQKLPQDLPPPDRPVARRWRLAVVSFHGSLLTLMLVLALTTGHNVQIAVTNVPPTAPNK